MTMTMHDYNEEVSVELPASAQQAMEIPGM
jgi:hypothetical protein